MKALVIRYTAPMMSFGTVSVDSWRPSGLFPGLSGVTGLLGAALGYKRHQTDQLQRLQARLRMAARIDRQGDPLTDYQTVDLGQPWMDGSDKGVGWTTRGHVESRGKGESNRGTHIRLRDYWADAVATLVVTVVPDDEKPTVPELAHALQHPCHPLYLGRKSCPPAEPVFVEEREGESLRDLLAEVPAHPRANQREMPSQWPVEEEPGQGRDVLRDRRDWPNQVHAGSREAWRGVVSAPIAGETKHG